MTQTLHQVLTGPTPVAMISLLTPAPGSLPLDEGGYDDEPTLAAGAAPARARWQRPATGDRPSNAPWWRTALQRLHLLPGASSHVPERVRLARHDFEAALADIPSAAAERAVHGIRRARGLHELWYLRSQVFDAVSMAHSQKEAAHRLERLNQHFPTRSLRSGFVPL